MGSGSVARRADSRIVERARVPSSPSKPSKRLIVLISFVLGLGLGAGLQLGPGSRLVLGLGLGRWSGLGLDLRPVA